MVWKTLRFYVKTIIACFQQGPSSSATSSSTTTTRLGLIVYPEPQGSPTHAWIRSRLRYQGQKEFLTNLWRRWNAAARALLGRIRPWASLQIVQENNNLASAATSFRHTSDSGSQGGPESSTLDARDLSQLSRVVSDILTLMRMACHAFVFPHFLTMSQCLIFCPCLIDPILC